jgi:hypothetical protein
MIPVFFSFSSWKNEIPHLNIQTRLSDGGADVEGFGFLE